MLTCAASCDVPAHPRALRAQSSGPAIPARDRAAPPWGRGGGSYIASDQLNRS